MRFKVLAAMLVAALTAQTTAADDAKKIQCWTDKNGQRMCGDRVPPEYSGQKRDVMKEGRVVDTISATKSADEVAAEKKKQEAEEAQIKAAEYDRALLEMYRTPKDITSTRDERLVLVDGRIQAAEKNASDIDKTLASLRARAEAQQKKNQPVDDKLAKQIKQFENSQAQNTKALERYRKEREALQAKFDKDYMRFSELRGLPVTSPPPPPAAAKAEPAEPAPAAGEAATPAQPAEPAKKPGAG